jgi:hypothetical protein
METFKINFWKITGIALFSSLFATIIHALWTPLFDYNGPKSFIIENGLFPPAVIILFFITFWALALVFTFIQDKLPGRKLLKGLRYGISFGVLWLIGMFEMSIAFGSPLKYEFFSGLLDCLSLILFGLLLGRFIATDSNRDVNEKSKIGLIPIFIIASLFIVERYFRYFTLTYDNPGYFENPLITFTFTLSLGLWIGAMYWLLRQELAKYSPAKRALWFGGIVFGIDWLFYSLFLFLFLKLPLIEILLVPAFDILSVIIGIFIFEKVHEAVSPKVRPSRFYQRQFPLPILYTGAKPWIGEREL